MSTRTTATGLHAARTLSTGTVAVRSEASSMPCRERTLLRSVPHEMGGHDHRQREHHGKHHRGRRPVHVTPPPAEPRPPGRTNGAPARSSPNPARGRPPAVSPRSDDHELRLRRQLQQQVNGVSVDHGPGAPQRADPVSAIRLHDFGRFSAVRQVASRPPTRDDVSSDDMSAAKAPRIQTPLAMYQQVDN